MTFDLQRILESKRTLRRDLASRPVAEKLAMLDVLRDRARTIQEAAAGRRNDFEKHLAAVPKVAPSGNDRLD